MKPLILAGGGGTRLWPFSTNENPKQFLDLVTPNVSLIRGTFDRLLPFVRPEDIFISTGEIYAEKSLAHCPIPAENLVLEPARRNNAPAIGLSLITMLEQGATEDDVVVLFPSDHLIANTELFVRACLFSEKVIQANPGAVLTWGIEPTYPETGYGYIEVAPEKINQESGIEALRVASFKEKPKLEVAQEYVESGKYFWNAGIFFFRLGSMLELYKTHLPETHDLLMKVRAGMQSGRWKEAILEFYPQMTATSIDFGIIEKITDRIVVPMRGLGWDDVGSYESLYQVSPKGDGENVNWGENFLIESHGNLVRSTTKPITMVGVDNMIVLETPKAIMIIPRDKAQDVKKMVDFLKEKWQDKLL